MSWPIKHLSISSRLETSSLRTIIQIWNKRAIYLKIKILLKCNHKMWNNSSQAIFGTQALPPITAIGATPLDWRKIQTDWVTITWTICLSNSTNLVRKSPSFKPTLYKIKIIIKTNQKRTAASGSIQWLNYRILTKF